LTSVEMPYSLLSIRDSYFLTSFKKAGDSIVSPTRRVASVGVIRS